MLKVLAGMTGLAVMVMVFSELGVPASTPGARAADPPRVLVEPGETNTAEVRETIDVGRSPSTERFVVMRLRPDEIPQLRRGDRVRPAAELEVTTRCDIGQTAPGCDYNPTVKAQLVLSGRGDDTDPDGSGSARLSEVAEQSCTKADHHCKFVFRFDSGTVLDGALGSLPCVAQDSCYINLVAWAHDPGARSGGLDKLLIGSNDGNYLDNRKVEQDQGRLMVARERDVTQGDRNVDRDTPQTGRQGIPTNADPKVVYSYRLNPGQSGIPAGAQYLIESALSTEVSDRARFSTKMFVTRDPDSTDGNGLAGMAPGAIAEHNGINCTSGTSPCVTRRVGLFRVTQDINGPVWVNVVGISSVPGGGSANVTVRRADGWVEATRYRPALRD